MKNKKKEQKDTSLHWCYIGENKEYVMMTCTREDWEKIRDVVEWARKRLDQDLARESDEFNYGYTRENR